MANKGKIAVVGCGLIGHSWAMLFASAGYNVSLYDKDSNVTSASLNTIKNELEKLESTGLLRGKLTAKEQFNLISPSETLEECVKNAFYVQESVPEIEELKKIVFKKLDQLASNEMILASSTSCILPSKLSENLKHASRVIVAHPANPPYFVPIVEMVPSPITSPDVVTKTRELMKEIGQKPVVCKKEIFGFAINRMQISVVHECWRLVQDGVMSVEDVDAVMSEGLGMRYAFLGTFETCQLNADGMVDYCSRYAKGIHKVSETFGPPPKMEGPVAEEIHRQLCEKVPLHSLDQRRKWRDDRLAYLAKLKKSMGD